MKKSIVLIALATICYTTTSCSSFKDKGLTDYYSLYDKKIDKIKVPPFLLNTLAGKAELKPILKYIQSAELVTVNNATSKMKKNLQSAIKYDQFQKYFDFNLAGEPITMYAIEENEVVKNIIFSIQSGENIRLIDAKVNVPFSEFEKVLSKL